MEYISLYRKYRPTSFKTVVGQKYIIKTLSNSIKLDKIAHAYIFSGSKGIGKTSIAKIFAKAVNCLHPIDGDACDNCESCNLIKNNQTTDIIELDAASNNGVEEIRNIIETVNFLPTQLKYKVYIIDEAHMLTTSAWNALLKTIEEPPHHVIFIFATTEMNKIPPTIISRCQNFQFSRMNDADAHEILNRVIKNENIKINEQSISKIIQLASGSARDLLSILDQLCLYTNNDIDLKSINETFGLIDVECKIEFINLLISNNLNEIITRVNQYTEKGINFSIFVSDIISILLDSLIYKQTNSTSNLKLLNESNVNSFQLSIPQLIKLINIWQKNYIQIKTASDSKSVFMIGVFESLNSINVLESSASVKTPIKQQTPISNKPIFEFKTVHIHEPEQVKKPEEKKQEPVNKEYKKIEQPKIPTESLDSIFLKIAKNTSKTLRSSAAAVIDSIKSDDDAHPLMSPIFESSQVVVASNNGIVLLFADQSQANVLNKNYSSKKFQEQLIKYSKHPMHIIGFTKSKINELVNVLKSNHEQLSDVGLESLQDNIKDKSLLSLAELLIKE